MLSGNKIGERGRESIIVKIKIYIGLLKYNKILNINSTKKTTIFKPISHSIRKATALMNN